MKNKLSFKNNKGTGRWSWTQPINHSIKVDRLDIGNITQKSSLDKRDIQEYGIDLCILKTDEEVQVEKNCVFKTITLKKRFDTVEEAKLFLERMLPQLINKYRLYDIDTKREIILKV